MPAARHTLSVVTPPATLSPVDVAAAKAHIGLPVAGTGHDAELQVLIDAATEFVQARTSLQLMLATLELGLECFPPNTRPYPMPIVLPVGKVGQVVSVKYTNDAETPAVVEWDTQKYDVVTSELPAFLYPVADELYPDDVAGRRPNVIKVEFTAGDALPADTPHKARLAILQLVAHWFEFRATVTAGSPPSSVPWSTGILLQQLNWGDEFEEFAV